MATAGSFTQATLDARVPQGHVRRDDIPVAAAGERHTRRPLTIIVRGGGAAENRLCGSQRADIVGSC
jgi:hypothetical protein